MEEVFEGVWAGDNDGDSLGDFVLGVVGTDIGGIVELDFSLVSLNVDVAIDGSVGIGVGVAAGGAKGKHIGWIQMTDALRVATPSFDWSELTSRVVFMILPDGTSFSNCRVTSSSLCSYSDRKHSMIRFTVVGTQHC